MNRLSFLQRLSGALLAVLATASHADFAVVLSPPRFELAAEAGTTLRHTIDVANAAPGAVNLTVRTVDWVYHPDRTVEFFDELQPNSCRPWVAIERRDLAVRAGRPYRFRFEVAPPPGTPPMECRFALMFEGRDDVVGGQGDLRFPINARLAAIVYVAVGGVKPELGIVSSSVQKIDGAQSPVVIVRNSGQAHGRLRGILSGTDADGAQLEFAPATEPVLPGETRAIRVVASPRAEPERPITPRLPAIARGKLDMGNGKTQEVELRFEP